MRQATAGRKTGIHWKFTKQLEDMDFADDISFLYHRQQDSQEKLSRVVEEAEKTGLQINTNKTDHEGKQQKRRSIPTTPRKHQGS
jgi:hypothetical protein